VDRSPKIDFGFGAAHSPLEVAVIEAMQRSPPGRSPHVTPEAGAAGGIADERPASNQRFEICPVFNRFW